MLEEEKLRAGVVPAVHGAGVNGDKTGRSIRIEPHIDLADIPAQRLPDQHRPLDILPLQDFLEIPRQILHGKIQPEGTGGPVSGRVPDQTGKALAQRVELFVKQTVVGGESRQKNKPGLFLLCTAGPIVYGTQVRLIYVCRPHKNTSISSYCASSSRRQASSPRTSSGLRRRPWR